MFIYHDLYSLKKLITLFPLDFTLALAGNIIEIFNFTYLCNQRKLGTYYCKEGKASNKRLKVKCLKAASQIMTKQAQEQAKKLE